MRAVEPAKSEPLHNVRRAFGMRENDNARILFAEKLTSSAVKRSCTLQWPFQVMIFTFVFRDILREIFIGQEDDFRHAEGFDDLFRIAGGAADIGLRLHRRRSVDVSDNRHAGIFRARIAHVFGRNGFRERTSGALDRGSKPCATGLSSFAVSAMKCTPAMTITSAFTFTASRAR